MYSLFVYYFEVFLFAKYVCLCMCSIKNIRENVKYIHIYYKFFINLDYTMLNAKYLNSKYCKRSRNIYKMFLTN